MKGASVVRATDKRSLGPAGLSLHYPTVYFRLWDKAILGILLSGSVHAVSSCGYCSAFIAAVACMQQDSRALT